MKYWGGTPRPSRGSQGSQLAALNCPKQTSGSAHSTGNQSNADPENGHIDPRKQLLWASGIE